MRDIHTVISGNETLGKLSSPLAQRDCAVVWETGVRGRGLGHRVWFR